MVEPYQEYIGESGGESDELNVSFKYPYVVQEVDRQMTKKVGKLSRDVSNDRSPQIDQ